MNTSVKYPIIKKIRMTKAHDAIIERIAAALAPGHPGQGSSEGAVVRAMIEHCATCELFFAAISIDKNISAE